MHDRRLCCPLLFPWPRSGAPTFSILESPPVDKRWLSVIIITCKPGPAVGLDFFQLRVHSVIPCLRSLPTDVYFENCITKYCQGASDLTHQWLQYLKFGGNRSEQLYSVQPLPSCATVLVNVPFNKSLHHNHA